MSKAIQKVLIANRGEIAVRIIRACRQWGIETVAVFSDADSESLHVKLADQAFHIGPAPASESYLQIGAILEAVEKSQCDAVHPGYGLLSENPDFSEAILQAGKIFIGPKPKAMKAMGNKTEARACMIQAGVPVVPGSESALVSVKEATQTAKTIGYPVLIKAVSGGGGRGMRVVEKAEDLAHAFESASREAQSAFGDGRLYMEKFLHHPRHIEIQVLADNFGHCVHLGERECSIQRRHQKIIEEAPSTVLTSELRDKMGQCAIQAAKAVDYCSAGTVEFLLDEEKNFYFIEMNTRLQVEHPVTEIVYGLDLVYAQIQIANGEKCSLVQKNLKPRGWAMECRIYAEDPDQNDQPCPGQITDLRLPGGPGVRIDSFVYSGYEVPVHYDPMIGKLITWGENRQEAINRMLGALGEFQIQGIKTNMGLLQQILNHAEFQSGRYHIHFLKEAFAKKKPPKAIKSQGTKGIPGEISRKEIAAIGAALSEFQEKQEKIPQLPQAKKGSQRDYRPGNSLLSPGN